MFREINDGDRTGYTDVDGRRVATIRVNGHAQIIGDCKYIEIDKDTKKVKSIRKDMPSTKPKATKAATKKPTETDKKDK